MQNLSPNKTIKQRIVYLPAPKPPQVGLANIIVLLFIALVAAAVGLLYFVRLA